MEIYIYKLFKQIGKGFTFEAFVLSCRGGGGDLGYGFKRDFIFIASKFSNSGYITTSHISSRWIY